MLEVIYVWIEEVLKKCSTPRDVAFFHNLAPTCISGKTDRILMKTQNCIRRESLDKKSQLQDASHPDPESWSGSRLRILTGFS